MEASADAPLSDAAPASDGEQPEQEPVPPGNPLRPRALFVALPALLALLLLMASDTHFALSVPLGALAALIAALALLDFAGSFDDARVPVLASLKAAQLAPRLLEATASAVGCVAALRLAVAGTLPAARFTAPLLVTAASLWVLLSGARLLARAGVLAPARRLRARHGLWLLALGTLLYVPLLGGFSLLDPWETHYGEVARELLSRDDWLSLWWAQDGWFWSKPVLDFWLQGLAFSLLGVAFQPGKLLASAGQGHFPAPEWAARMPVVVLTLLASYLLYKAVAVAAGRRAGFVSGLLMLCAPYWSLLSHQSMTDMPYVAPLSAGLALFALGLYADPERLAPAVELSLFGRVLRVSAFHLLLVLVLASALPQLAYLLSRNLTLQLAGPPYGFRWHLDELFSGSGGGNCGLPGNEACRHAEPVNALFQPSVGALLFGAGLGYLLLLNRGERRVKRLYFLGAWYCTALAALAKGAPGLVLPLAVAALTIVAERRWRELPHIELLGLGLLLGCVCLPWYVQSYMRHGEPFTDRLLFHDMYKRAFVHVHDTNTGDDVSFRYYVWQLGYGLFPWSALGALGLGLGLHDAQRAGEPRRRTLAVLSVAWLLVGFGMFSLSLTKFHHYALPCVPPLAVLAGLLLDHTLGDGLPSGKRAALYLAGMGSSALLLLYGALCLRPGTASGRVFADGTLQPASALRAAVFLALGLLLAVLTARKLGVRAPPEASAARAPEPMLAALALLAAALTLLVARDLSSSLPGDVPGSARLLHLVTYNYRRAWPATLDFEAVGLAFGVVAAGSCAALAVPRARAHGSVLLCAVCVWFCVFTLDVYLPRVAPHYGQRELFLTYYRARQNAREPIVAYQMNWKGENFYAGNRIPAFVSSGAKFKSWLRVQRNAGTKVMFFVLQHERIGTLKSELGAVRELTTLTDKALNNKFALVRVELGEAPPAQPDLEEPAPEE